MKKFNLHGFTIKPQHIVVAHTSEPDYEMYRKILLEVEWGKYVVVEGGHCSCYGMDEVEWDAIEYSTSELRKIAFAPYNKNSEFWRNVRTQLY